MNNTKIKCRPDMRFWNGSEYDRQAFAAAREAAGITIQQISKRAKLDTWYVRKIENGKGSTSGIRFLRLAQALEDLERRRK